MTLSISTIEDILKPITVEATINAPESEISIPLIDSRALTWPECSMFFAITTPVNDGHNYLHDLVARGVRNFVVERLPEWMAVDGEHINAIVVKSTVEALHLIARYLRSQFKGQVVGITGSRGKTVVKEMLYRVLCHNFDIVRSPRSWNSQIGVPLSLWQIRPDADLAIFEAGISCRGEMESLEDMVRPTIGVLTDITAEHSDGFVSLEEKCREKALLFRNAEVVFYPATCHIAAEVLGEMYPEKEILAVDTDPANPSASMCMAVARYLMPEISFDVDAKALLEAIPDTRIAVHEGVNNCLITYDDFTCDLQSVTDALDFISRRSTAGRTTTLIISDLETGTGDDRETYARLAAELKQKKVSRLIAIGPEFARVKELFNTIPEHDFIATTAEFTEKYDISRFADELILIKGAPAFNFHEIKQLLESPRHETILEVNLDALIHNYNHFRSMLKPSTGMIAMVKASAYGIGALETAKTLQSQGAAYLAVAVVDEGVELRRAGITMPILVLNPIGTNYRALFANRLEPSVFNMRELKLLIDQAERYGVTDYPVHIKLDTGMHRVGFIEDELDDLCRTLARTSSLRISTIFSHLATADCLNLDQYTEHQLSTFRRMSDKILAEFPYRIRRHVLNTAGIMRYADYQFDLVRLGIGLYGISPIELPGEGGLQPVARFLSTVVSIKHWPKGTSIGYGCRGVLDHDAVIATVPVGYADGIDRHLGCGAAQFVVNGVPCPTVGNICMDQCMLDVTDANASIGDTVEIFGTQAPLRRLSETLGTIPYEILTSVSPRVKRIYFRE